MCHLVQRPNRGCGGRAARTSSIRLLSTRGHEGFGVKWLTSAFWKNRAIRSQRHPSEDIWGPSPDIVAIREMQILLTPPRTPTPPGNPGNGLPLDQRWGEMGPGREAARERRARRARTHRGQGPERRRHRETEGARRGAGLWEDRTTRRHPCPSNRTMGTVRQSSRAERYPARDWSVGRRRIRHDYCDMAKSAPRLCLPLLATAMALIPIGVLTRTLKALAIVAV